MRLTLFQLDAAEAAGGGQGLAGIERRVRVAADGGADLVLLPELAIPGYGAGAEAIRTQGERARETLAYLRALSDETGTSVALGMPMMLGGRLHNTAVLCRPAEEPVVYAKRFLYGDYERDLFRVGTQASPLVMVAGLRIGLLVCFDVEFPETVRALALAGADLVLIPTALPAGEGARFIARSLVPTRAFENGIFVAYADWSGADGRFVYQGMSIVAAPDGRALACAGTDGAAMLIADLDPAHFDAARAANDYLRELRTTPSGSARPPER
ncbi:nitrilase-related carbon-nitrogen hydrolase [Aureimonas sp. ME7]|uniref:nitrilase-related carbon-nitrogen hydrolase n=1 Tax=Aureimonas sp. ME7 TaxID=2744252 RepID=UPI0015F7243C|nr:nitrilase-related carbon-nitrogen hydrolase [Aureimonas sp. ME7]